MLAETTRKITERIKTSCEQETGIYLRHVCTHSVQHQKRGGSLSRCFSPNQAATKQKHGPCGEAMPTRGRGEGRQRHVAEGWQGAGATSMIPPRALSTKLPHIDAGAWCPNLLFFLLQTPSSGHRKSSRALGPAATHAHRTARPTHTPNNAPRWRRWTAFALLP